MNTKQTIVYASIDLFKELGYDRVSIPKICEKAKITKGTFYYYFQNKGEVIYEYIEQIFTDCYDFLPDVLKCTSPKEQLWKLLSYAFDNIIALTPRVLYAYYQVDMKNHLQQLSPLTKDSFGYYANKYATLQLSLIEKAQECKEIRNDKTPIELFQTYQSIIVGIGLDWSSREGCYDEKAVLRRMFDIVFCK